MQAFIDFAPTKGCNNPDSYGTICVQCNKCGRFRDDKTMPKPSPKLQAVMDEFFEEEDD